jgi:RNA polymerase sigma-70 factor, ECF subfamily
MRARGFYGDVCSPSPDFELVSRLRARKPGAFDELYRGERNRIWRFLRQLTGSVQAAEDLFQETWLAAARNVHRLREDTHVVSWLYTIARNKHRNALRSRVFDERRRARIRAEPVATVEPPDVAMDVRTRAKKLAAAFARLPEAYREVVLLCCVEGLDAEEVARILDLRPDAVRKRLSRARAALADLMENLR